MLHLWPVYQPRRYHVSLQTAWVEPVTRERVEKAMRDLNYRRNAAAIALAKRSGDMLGLLTGNLADPFLPALLAA